MPPKSIHALPLGLGIRRPFYLCFFPAFAWVGRGPRKNEPSGMEAQNRGPVVVGMDGLLLWLVVPDGLRFVVVFAFPDGPGLRGYGPLFF